MKKREFRKYLNLLMAMCIWTTSIATAAPPTNNGPGKPPTGASSDPKPGDLYPGGVSTDHPQVYYEPSPHNSAEVDRTADGYLRVWSFSAPADGKKSRILYGHIQADGTVKWTNDGLQQDLLDKLVEIQRYRPSNLQKTLDWDGQKSGTVAEVVRRYTGGGKIDLGAIRQKTVVQGGQVASNSISFFIAMGVVAAITIMIDNPNDPVALENYAASLTDPVGWMMLIGFMAAATPFLRKVGAFTSGKAIIRSLPWFVASMLAGTLAQGVMTYAADPDVMRCVGLHTHIISSQNRDMASCDRAYDKFLMEEVTANFLPSFATAILASGIYVGAEGFMWVTGLSAAIRAMAVRIGFRGGWATMLVSTGLFVGAYLTAQKGLKVDQWMHEYLLAGHNLSSSPYGATIPESESRLYKVWADIKKRSWVDFPAEDVHKICEIFDPSSGVSGNFSCGTPVDFAGTMERYATMQSKWRQLKFVPTYSAHRKWIKRVGEYHEILDAAGEAYVKFAERIQYELQNPGLTIADARGFNATMIQNLADEHTPGHVYPGDSGAPAYVVQGDPLFAKSFANTWSQVQTSNFYEFIVASMACGPEVEGYGPSKTLLDRAGQFLSDWLPLGPTNPTTLIDHRPGVSLKFYPPRITNPLEGTRDTFCNGLMMVPESSQLSSIYPIMSISFETIGTRMRQRNYKNLFEYIKNNVRASVLTKDTNQLAKWWNSTVTPQVLERENQLYTEYAEMLNSTYRPALANPDYYYCDPGTTHPEFAPYLKQLAPLSAKACAANGTRHLAFGIIASIGDEMRLYTAMLVDLYKSTHPGDDGQKVLEAGKSMLHAFSQFGRKLSIVEPLKRGDIRVPLNAMSLSYNTLAALTLPPPPQPPTPSPTPAPAVPDTHEAFVARRLLYHIDLLMVESLNYLKVLAEMNPVRVRADAEEDLLAPIPPARPASMPPAGWFDPLATE